MTKPKLGRLLRFGRVIAANSATLTVWLLLLNAAASLIVGVFILSGGGWAFIAGACASLLGAAFLRHGMVRQ